jgi:hypothetical protein
MTFELLMVVGMIAVVILLFRIDHTLMATKRNLEQIAAALRAKS